MDGSAFSEVAILLFSLLPKVNEASQESQKMQSVARYVPYLIQRSSFRMPYQGRNGPPDGVCGFAELIDMFHKAEASKIHDKVYALLAMSTEDMGASGLLPDYTIPFGRLLKRVVSVLISDKMSVTCQGSIDAAVIGTTGYVLAKIRKIRDDVQSPQLQRIEIKLSGFHDRYDGASSFSRCEASFDRSDENKRDSSHQTWYIQGSAVPLRKGDLICYLYGATRPTIIRLCQDYSTIIVAAISRSETKLSRSEERLAWPNDIEARKPSKRRFYLVWDWSYSSDSHFEKYAAWARSKSWVLDSRSTTQKNIDYLARCCDSALIYADAHGIESSEDRLREVLNGFESALQSEESCTRSREAFSEFLDRLCGHDHDKDGSNRYDLLRHVSLLCCWAAKEYCKNVTKLLIESVEVDEISIASLSSVAMAGYLDLVQLVLEEKTSAKYRSKKAEEALQSAAMGNHLPVIEYLLEAAHIDEHRIGQNMNDALVKAAKGGHLAVFERLLQAGADANARAPVPVPVPMPVSVPEKRKSTSFLNIITLDTSGKFVPWLTPLEAAAQGGNVAIFEPLLRANLRESYKGAHDVLPKALAAAAGAGHVHIVESLLQVRVGVNVSRNGHATPLLSAAAGGHLLIVERLIQAGADVNFESYPRHDKPTTPLIVAAAGGHLPVVKRLVQAGADVNGISFKSRSDGVPTPLIAAAIAGHLPIVTWLLEAGADPKLTYSVESQRKRPTSLNSASSDLTWHHRRQEKLVARTAQELALKNGHYATAERLHEVLGVKNDNQRGWRMKYLHDTSSNEESSSGDES